jgi:hypothetical protein
MRLQTAATDSSGLPGCRRIATSAGSSVWREVAGDPAPDARRYSSMRGFYLVAVTAWMMMA